MTKSNTFTVIGTAIALALGTSAAIANETKTEPLIPVTVENFVEVEVDARIHAFTQAGGMNGGMVYDVPTPTDNQAVPRMNRDTLYKGIPVDTSEGYTISIPEHSDDRYVSVYVLDNDHKTLHILKGSGTTHTFDKQEDTRWVVAIPRIQVFDQADKDDVAIAAEILHSVTVTSDSMDEKPLVNWDWQGMMEMRSGYEQEMRDTITQYPSDWQGARGEVDRYEGHNMAVATSWGLFPSSETVYIAQAPDLGTEQCFTATYDVPEHGAFWSMTVYNDEGYMFSQHNNINSASMAMNEDGTATIHYGSEEVCGQVANRLDTTEGWNLLMRVYEPGQSVIDGDYKLPKIK